MQEFISTIIGGLKILFFKQENRRRGDDCGDIRLGMGEGGSVRSIKLTLK